MEQDARDQWGNPLPPTSPEDYGVERVGYVFRFAGGAVNPADGYFWHRDLDGGYITTTTEDGSYVRPTVYKTQAVFACSTMLPLVVVGTDPSVNPTYFQTSCGCNIGQPMGDGSTDKWSLLHFRYTHEPHLYGVSQANLGAIGRPYIAGRVTDWVRALIPHSYRNTPVSNDTLPVGGLSGQLPLVIGIMAFFDDKDKVPGEVFGSGKWHNGRWRSHTAARGCEYLHSLFCRSEAHIRPDPRPEERPRGFLVQICYDDLDYPDVSNQDLLGHLEWSEILVHD